MVDDRDLLAQCLGFLHVVRGQQDRLPLGVQHPQDVPEVGPGLRVEPCGRLVQEEHVRPVHQGPRDQQPLGLPAGQVGGHRLAPVREAEYLEQLLGPALGLAQAQAEEPATELQVLGHGQLHVERVVLGHHADPALHADRVGDHVHARHPCLTARRQDQRGEHADGGGLARAVRSQQPEELAGADGQVDAAHRGHVPARGLIGLAQVFGAYREPGRIRHGVNLC